MLSQIIAVVSGFGTLVAAAALVLTYKQFRRLDNSIRGNTYQLLSDQAVGMLNLLIEHPELKYLSIDSTIDPAERKQLIFERLIGNYLDNIWGQMKLGLMSKELAATYVSLIEQMVLAHPGLAAQMASPNFSASLRDHVAALIETRDAG